jgi:hypothetical protein
MEVRFGMPVRCGKPWRKESDAIGMTSPSRNQIKEEFLTLQVRAKRHDVACTALILDT